jgi:RNA polymerase sigma factor (sigma-70 family)
LSGYRETGEDLHEIVSDDFWRSVRQLPRRQRECVTLRYLEDHSVGEIAATLGIAEPTVRVHLHGARVALALALGESEEA